MRTLWGRIAGLAFVMACVVLVIPPVQAVPNFASQTGQPCTACHIGAFGPQLTPLGRAFKIGGYTQRGGEGWEAHLPLSAWCWDRSPIPVPAFQPIRSAHFNQNNNFALDQVSVFLAGGIGEHTGGFMSSPIPTSRTRQPR